MAFARFYPIVPDVAWVERIAPLGIGVVQLRMKGVAGAAASDAILRALDVTRQHTCQLIVNDYWREAIACGADYIHLGQEDLAAADLSAIRDAGVRVGVSTHDGRELDIALEARADYIALGPIYETTLKVMPFAPQGLDRISDWKRAIGDTPLIAIGGLTPQRAQGALDAGADSVAVVSDFITAEDPEARVRHWLSVVA